MGWTFYDLNSLPEPGEIAWCKWPQREDKGQPGEIARPVLVREAFVREDPKIGLKFGSVMVSYGTGNLGDHDTAVRDLIIGDMKRAHALGLHKPTRFSLDPRDKKHLLWCKEYFVAPDYVQSQGIRIGKLGDSEIEQLRLCLRARGLLDE